MDAGERSVLARLSASPFPAAALLFVSVCLLWLYCLPPGLAPYRDAGEMACDVYTLGIAHQPGYPLYILSAKLASLVLPGSFAYRLNLFSAFCGLAALLALYFPLSVRFGILPALFSVLLFSLNFTLQTVSGVSEMYSLNLLFAAALLWLALSIGEGPSRRKIWLAAYLMGLGMTNRMDIILTAPALLLAAWPGLRASTPFSAVKTVSAAAILWLAGFSLYLYLLVRSGSDPVFDWSHPADLGTFLAVITRKSYGSTLDLISRNYAPGELFWPNMKHYALHLLRNFNLALFFSAAGLAAEFRERRARFSVVAVFFAVSGPVFLYMANMPPNPHALAIVEPYYLIPDAAVIFWTAAGILFAARVFSAPRAAAAAAAVSIALAAWQNLPCANRRTVFAAEDWGYDVLDGVPVSASLVGKKDVQLFTLWYLQTVRGERPDLNLVSQGLSGSRWYQDSQRLRRPGLRLANLNSGGREEWENFTKLNPGGVYATLDAELPAGARSSPGGLISALYGSGAALDPWNDYNFRWLGAAYGDFFAKDLGASYAAAAVARAVVLNESGGLRAGDAERLHLARLMDPAQPEAPLYLGFYYSALGDWPRAGYYFLRSAELNERLLGLAGQYRSLPEVTAGLRRSGAYAWLNYGVALEKSGDSGGAEAAYKKTLEADPGMADAHYNMAILYWNRDPRRVHEELSAALRINPGHSQAAYYLGKIQRK